MVCGQCRYVGASKGQMGVAIGWGQSLGQRGLQGMQGGRGSRISGGGGGG